MAALKIRTIAIATTSVLGYGPLMHRLLMRHVRSELGLTKLPVYAKKAFVHLVGFVQRHFLTIFSENVTHLQLITLEDNNN